MWFLEAGQFSTRAAHDRRLLPLWQERWALAAVLAVALGVVPFWGNDYWFSAILIPFLALSLAGLGLNLLTGYAGQLSLGSAAFMAAGAFAAYNAQLCLPGLPWWLGWGIGGLVAAALSVLFGLPSLRIKGFYLIVSTLAAQFLIPWALVKFSWFSHGSASGVITAPPLTVAGWDLSHPAGRYLLTLVTVLGLTWVAHNMVRSELGRQWMAVRDMDTAAAVIGISLPRAKLLAFAISGFYLGVAGALWAFAYLVTVEPHGFDLARSFQILFIVIIGGLGSVAGAFLGAAFIVLFPLALSNLAGALPNGWIDAGQLENLQKMAFGALIILVLIREPEGLASLWQRWRSRARRWPLRH
ncbi:branched-chain amino acid ABC transporter permease [Ideonella dechloratans]|uniref:Branched-chain amino acid ABC transporter permease n=1 Tax=Ideonella dechloratans TaxID=36863 RepID=A0A643FFS7_IDEDE|nr:branched-chain amino acid ABC transporter permease [Ideonella dechloratans]KAB0583009.1 branched-chain amino acid ABC transporter permease [Ideonella dechloratans]UFU09592.1 branched-chain amino acid ABC transporter permease [Ideonella dechloratans]